MIVIKSNGAGHSAFQGSSLGNLIPVWGSIQTTIAAARARREPVYRLVNGRLVRC